MGVSSTSLNAHTCAVAAASVCVPLQVDFGEDVCIFGENLFISLTNEIERVSAGEGGGQGVGGPRRSAGAGAQSTPGSVQAS
jgi:hypothetical protein